MRATLFTFLAAIEAYLRANLSKYINGVGYRLVDEVLKLARGRSSDGTRRRLFLGELLSAYRCATPPGLDDFTPDRGWFDLISANQPCAWFS